MFEKEANAITLFFYLSLLSEKEAVVAAKKSIDHLYHKVKYDPQLEVNVNVIQITQKTFQNIGSEKYQNTSHIEFSSKLKIPYHLDLSYWCKLKQLCDESELHALIWHKILNFTLSEIAKALSVSEGTILYRLDRASKKLGQLITDNIDSNDKRKEKNENPLRVIKGDP